MSMMISPDYSVDYWQKLQLDPDNPDENEWTKAANVLQNRIQKRFLEPADALIVADAPNSRGTFGFAILALDFIVIETIQGFREGRTGNSQDQSVRFMKRWDEFLACLDDRTQWKSKAENLYAQGRCALHHRGSTDKIVVRRGERYPMLKFNDDGRIQINRTKFHRSLSDAFGRYIDELKQPESVSLRRCFKQKMDAICAD
ncbi:hypothetical protein [Rhizobium subbaraonis]|nr:hypothetical protein [Rhizobium subbaraonis]